MKASAIKYSWHYQWFSVQETSLQNSTQNLFCKFFSTVRRNHLNKVSSELWLNFGQCILVAQSPWNLSVKSTHSCPRPHQFLKRFSKLQKLNQWTSISLYLSPTNVNFAIGTFYIFPSTYSTPFTYYLKTCMLHHFILNAACYLLELSHT